MKSRTEYSAKNTTVAVICRILAIIMGYVLRIVFTHQLSSTYVGINGLFVDIIQVLSLSEMGVGTAITFALYQPVADGDIEKQKSLMRLFRHFYIGIAGAVACFGMILIPFLGTLIKDYGSMQYVVPIFLLYVTNAVCSYLWIYKKMLMDAHQLIYIGVSDNLLVHTGFFTDPDLNFYRKFYFISGGTDSCYDCLQSLDQL